MHYARATPEGIITPQEALVRCIYPPWAINRVQSKLINNNWGDNNDANNIQDGINNTTLTTTQNNNGNHTSQDPSLDPEVTSTGRASEDHNNSTANSANTTSTITKTKVGCVVVPYTKGLSESFKNICAKYGIQVHFKGNTTIKQAFMKSEDQNPKDNKSGLIYSYKCQDFTCREEYIGEASRALGDRHKEHLKGPSSIHVHIQCTGHNATVDNFKIIGREDRDLPRTIKEAIYIRVNNPSLNRNVGKYHLSHLWDRVLFNTPGLKIDSLHTHCTCIIMV